MASHPHELPADLPVPEDDGAALHLLHSAVADISLPATSGLAVSLRKITRDPCVLFFYPRTGVPGQPPHLGFNGEDWDSISGARGCTPQSCGFRDAHDELLALGKRVAGVSAQSLEDQVEFAERNGMPFPVISDPERRLGAVLGLPTLEIHNFVLYKRLALVAEKGRVVKVFYPVFPPDENAADVLAWLRSR